MEAQNPDELAMLEPFWGSYESLLRCFERETFSPSKNAHFGFNDSHIVSSRIQHSVIKLLIGLYLLA
jgi:hypothetical protein